MSERYIPTSIRRQLRQESGFGCAQCGNPILEYHHIIPWAEENIHRPEHMVALCGTCHTSVGKLRRDVAYQLKEQPKNIRDGKITGLLGTDRAQPSFILGTNTYIRTPNIFTYYGVSILKYDIHEGQNLISAYLPKDDFWPELRIVENDMTMETSMFWDIDFKTNFFRVQRKARDTFFEIDLRGEHAKVSANFSIRGEAFTFDERKTSFGGVQINNCTFTDCGGGIGVGSDDERILLPNFAQSYPRAALLKTGQQIRWL